MARTCQISGKRFNNANRVSHSNHKTKHRQHPNIHWQRFWFEEEQRWVKLRVCTKVKKTIARYGLRSTVKRYGADPAILK